MSTWLLWSLISIVTGNPLFAAGVVLLLWFLGDRATFRVLPDFGRWFSRRDRMAKLRQTLDVNPHDRRSRFALAELQLERGAAREAAALLRPNLEAGDRDVFTLAALGTALARMGAHEEAERLLAEARRLEPEFRMGELDLVLGRMRLELGDVAGAREPLTRLLATRPGTVEGRYHLARVLDRLGDAPGAARLREEAWHEYALQPRFRRREDRRWAWRIRPWRPAIIAVVILLALLLAGLAISNSSAPTARAAELGAATLLPMPGPMPPPVTQGKVEVAGASLHYETFGAGEPVILLHGGAGNSEHWANQIPALAKRFKVIVLDSRGHGRSTRDSRPFSYRLMADDVVALMDALGLKQSAVVGWSDGGIVGLDLAIRHPERVQRLVVFGTNYDLSGLRSGAGPRATFAAYFERCAADYRRLSSTPTSWDAFVSTLRKMWNSQPDFKPGQLGRVAAPTLVVAGMQDEIIRQEHSHALSTLIPGARLLILRDASHFAPWQQPAAFNDALLGFLGG